MQAQFGEEAVKARPGKAFEDKRSAAPVGDVNMIPLGQRPPKEEKKEPELDPIPDVEWWDARILRDPEVHPFPRRTPLECLMIKIYYGPCPVHLLMGDVGCLHCLH